MLGNVWEWCADTWHDSYTDAPVDGQAWIRDGDDTVRVVRGGSWFSNLRTLRSAYRHFTLPEYRSRYTGIRLVRAPFE